MNRPKVKVIRNSRLVPKGFAALTIGRRIFVAPGAWLTHKLLAHELMHVLQWEKYGFFGFLWRYGWTWVRDGFSYTRIDFEEDAREPTPEVWQWATELLREVGP